jgi:hypothetical protein
MSSIPNSAMPHAKAETPEPPAGRKPTLATAFRIATAPAVLALGLGAIAVRALRQRRSRAPAG